MLRQLMLVTLWSGMLMTAGAQLKSPEAFLGYKIGDRFTPHWKIVSYFQHVAANAPTTVSLQQYGVTNEGRPLYTAFISSPENIANLESIRLNNLRLANLARDKAAPIEDKAPAIVWLSYNVHGNEASSSEAAMLMIYALADPGNLQTKEWLKNVVVVIDPCLNPDGRDRYVNWYNSIAGKTPNPQQMAREHDEPWPGGRTNHYNFDLNRDWAWQTQVESQQRVKWYNEWLPQVHVDYHEQYVNDPYYFAPAAQPFHEVITPWQREFQQVVGKNNAKYFDRNGWLYYTRELFDLFYPSYGDTYPIYNGAIGMTYEQAGHGIAGRAILNDEGDTLTLADRALHHFTTGLSTLETASQNAQRLVHEFRKFYSDAVSAGVGEYKTYVLRNTEADAARIRSLLAILDQNKIQYGIAGAGSGRGFNYATGKDENFSIANGDIVISSLQPKSALVKVLMEPRSRLVDSATYDISAWSLPYACGVTAWASRDRIVSTGRYTESKLNNPATSYGYVLEWNGLSAAKTVGQLLQKGVLLRYAEQPFDMEGHHFNRGAIIILKTANKSFGDDLWNLVLQTANDNHTPLYAVSTGFVDKGFDFGSEKVHPFKAPKTVMLTGEGVNGNAAGELWHFFEQQLDYPVTLVNASDAGGISWNDVNVLILPDGNYNLISDKSSFDNLKAWIQKGGKVIALDNAVAQLARTDLGLHLKKEDENKKDTTPGYNDLKKFGDRERDAISGFAPGAILKVDLDNTHPLAFGYPDTYYTLKMGDNIYDFFKGNGWNVGVIKKDNQVAGFIGAAKKDRFKDGLLFGVQSIGNGSVVYFADDIIFRSFWENGKLMLCNALFLVGQ